MRKWVFIDGHSLAYRAFYALPTDLATSSGQLTNAVYGFTAMLIKVLEELEPHAVIVAFDKGKPLFRTEKFADYKAHRKPMPDELREQMEIIHAVLEALDIPLLEEEGYEADDVLATLADMLPEGSEAFIVTSDRDALQLVSEKVKVITNRRGITDILVYDADSVRERYGVDPDQIVDYLALKGDASDNIPGVPGIGEKTAAALMRDYGSLDGVYEHLDEIRPARTRRALEENRESALMSRELATMRRDVPIRDRDAPGWEMRPWDDARVSRVFDALEFRKLFQRLSGLKGRLFPHVVSARPDKGDDADMERANVESEEGLRKALSACESAGILALYARIEGEGYTRGRTQAVTVCAGDGVYRFRLDVEESRERFGRLLSRVSEGGLHLRCYRGKDMMVQLSRMFGFYPACDFDVELASYLLDPSGARHDLESAASRHLGISPPQREPGQLGLLEEEGAVSEDDMRSALLVRDLAGPLESSMESKGLRALYEEVERPLQSVLAAMEIRGIRLDCGALEAMREELEKELRGLEERAFDLAGESFNLNSPQQLSRILFEVLDLPPLRRTKTGLATDAGVLAHLAEIHPIAGVLVRYRELSKLLNTYVNALPRLVDAETGRLHACFNQAVTATGRLSSSNPNLQNIPVRTALGKNIRKAFLPTSPDGLILSADYSQIELRVMAHLSGDVGLRRAFEEGRDIHASTAAKVFDVPFDKVTAELRRKAKAINFGIIYGISPFGLAEQLGIGQEEAERYIEEYFREFPGVRRFLDWQVEEAAKTGHVTTILGRRREIPELAEGNARMHRLGERLAFNTPIQGSAADIIKVAMLRIHRRLEEGGYVSRMILQVHDELVFDVEADERQELQGIVRHEMESACDLAVPLQVDMGAGPSWYDAK